MSALRFHDLTVKRVSPEAAGAVAITFDIPADARERFAFEPGQFLTLRATIDGQDVSVTVCRKLPTVTIHDQSGINEDIFMQGDDAQEFIDAFDGLVEEAPDVLFVDALKHLALPWVEVAWQ